MCFIVCIGKTKKHLVLLSIYTIRPKLNERFFMSKNFPIEVFKRVVGFLKDYKISMQSFQSCMSMTSLSLLATSSTKSII